MDQIQRNEKVLICKYSQCKSSIFDKVDGHIEESNGNKYLIFAHKNKNKEKVKTKKY